MPYDNLKTLMEREVFLNNFRLAAQLSKQTEAEIAEKSNLPIERIQELLGGGAAARPVAVIDMYPLAKAVGSTVEKLNGWD